MEVRALCNKCGSQKKYINKDKMVYFCFKCGDRGRLAGGLLPPPIRTAPARQIDMFTFKIKNAESRAVYEYMLGRGFPSELIEKCVRWSPDLSGRAILPLWTGDKIPYWTARAINGAEPKYLSSGQKSKFVYGIDRAKGWAVLCEGPLDALASPNGIAIMGKIPSAIQLSLIASRFSTVFLAIDGDAPKERLELKRQLQRYLTVKEVYLEADEDPASLGIREMESRIREARV